MNFVGSTLYYALCIIALIVLIAALIRIQIRAARQKKERDIPIYKDVPHIPRYAAGDDMDQINRKATTIHNYNRYTLSEILSISASILILTLVAIAKIFGDGETRSLPHSTAPSLPSQPVIDNVTPTPPPIAGKLETALISAEFNSDNSKIFVTYSYKNQSNQNFYSINSTIQLVEETGVIVLSQKTDTVEKLTTDEEKEYIIAIEIDPSIAYSISQVKIETTYSRISQ